MTTTADLTLIEAWQQTHSDVQPYAGKETCARMLIARYKRTELCGAPACWLKDFAVAGLGRCVYCTRCLVGLVRRWMRIEEAQR